MKLFWLLIALVICTSAARAEVQMQEGKGLYPDFSSPLCQWKDDKLAPKAIIVAIHGATLHGSSYDNFGRLLAQHQYLVVAPDMQGFGHFYHEAASPEDQRLIYDRSEQVFVQLIKVMREQYPGLPVICAGESTGAQIGVRLAADHPELLDGVLLSSTSTRLIIPPAWKIAPDLTKSFIHPRRQVDLSPYIKEAISEDPRIVEERLTDPLGRNKLSLTQMCKIYWLNKKTLEFADKIPEDMPVLALQGREDHLFEPANVSLLMSMMKGDNKKLEWFDGFGHILIETNYMKPEVSSAVLNWLDSHATKRETVSNVASEATQKSEELRD